jgi:FMN-dependent NADH-azoreductase
MAVLLHIDSSPLQSSVTRELTREFTTAWTEAHPESTIIHRDLTQNPPAPINAVWISASYTPEAARTSEQHDILAVSNQLVSELEQADEYVLGVAMHNFSIPSTLKLWIDQVARAGRTFSYGPNGPEGLLKGKKATVIIATGGNYAPGTAASAYNFVEPYLKTVLGFLGITNVEFVTAGGASQLSSGKVDRSTFLKPSVERIRNLAA